MCDRFFYFSVNIKWVVYLDIHIFNEIPQRQDNKKKIAREC